MHGCMHWASGRWQRGELHHRPMGPWHACGPTTWHMHSPSAPQSCRFCCTCCACNVCLSSPSQCKHRSWGRGCGRRHRHSCCTSCRCCTTGHRRHREQRQAWFLRPAHECTSSRCHGRWCLQHISHILLCIQQLLRNHCTSVDEDAGVVCPQGSQGAGLSLRAGS